MSTKKSLGETFDLITKKQKCCGCNAKPKIAMTKYATDDAIIILCTACAAQLARKLMEDICCAQYDARHG